MLGIFRGPRPDITPAQIIGGIPVVAEGLHTFGIYTLSAAQQASLTKAVAYGLALVVGDAAVRIGRNVKDGRVEAAALSAPVAPHDAVTPPAPVDDLDEVLDDDLVVDELETDDELPEPVDAAPAAERQP